MKKDWQDQHEFFSTHGQRARERWVAIRFLTALPISFDADEVRDDEPQASDIDINFRGAHFQIKEIPDPNTRRSGEVKATNQRVQAAKTLQETIGPTFANDVPPTVNGYELVRDQALLLARDPKYIGSKQYLDLLLYVTRTRASVPSVGEVERKELGHIGWRSIGCLFGEQAIVLYAGEKAPKFLRTAAGNQEEL
jgi:hypothetical protein